MNVTLTTEEIITQQRVEIGNLYHQLIIEKMTSAKLAEQLEKYELAEAEKNPVSQPVRRLSAAVETLPATEDQRSTDGSP